MFCSFYCTSYKLKACSKRINWTELEFSSVSVLWTGFYVVNKLRCMLLFVYSRPTWVTTVVMQTCSLGSGCCRFCSGHKMPTEKGPFSWSGKIFFTTRCYASAVLAMGLCLSVCLSVRHKSVFYRNGWLAGFWHVSFLPPVLHCVKRKFGYLQK